MPSEPRHPPTVPSYGGASLADLCASVAAAAGIPPFHKVMGGTPERRACILLVDGLGWEQLRDHPAAAPFLSELARNSRPLTAGFPSTTVTSMSSLCTGLPPGQHGMVGLQFLLPATGKLLNGLNWDKHVDPWHAQPHPTIYERAVEA